MIDRSRSVIVRLCLERLDGVVSRGPQGVGERVVVDVRLNRSAESSGIGDVVPALDVVAGAYEELLDRSRLVDVRRQEVECEDLHDERLDLGVLLGGPPLEHPNSAGELVPLRVSIRDLGD